MPGEAPLDCRRGRFLVGASSPTAPSRPRSSRPEVGPLPAFGGVPASRRISPTEFWRRAPPTPAGVPRAPKVRDIRDTTGRRSILECLEEGGLVYGRRVVKKTTLVTTERPEHRGQRDDDVVAAVDVSRPSRPSAPRWRGGMTSSTSPSASAASDSGFWPAIIGLSPWSRHLQVEDQVVGVAVAVLAVLGHHRLDDHAQAAGEARC